MSSNGVRRRTVLRTLATAGVLAGLPTGAAGARDPDSGECPPADLERTGALANCPDTHLATVDRIVDGAHAVLLVENEGTVVDQIVVPAASWPDLAEGDVVLVTLDDGDLIRIDTLPGETDRRRGRLARRLDTLLEPVGERLEAWWPGS